jgi:nicotinate-nucleotide--dimethylbenzimidazole phosphoribosyltransferase
MSVTPPDSRSALRRLLASLPAPDGAAEAAARARQAELTKPAGSLGRLEELALWMAAWQGRALPVAERIRILVFAGNHGIAERGVSAYPATVTREMVRNFERGGAAINQLARWLGAELVVIPLSLERPTADFTAAPALSESELWEAFAAGMRAADAGADLVCLGEMGIGNTTAASALCAALFGGTGAAWAGPGTGLDPAGMARKAAVIDAGLARHAGVLEDPIAVFRHFGGHELVALAGAVLGCRLHRVPVLLDGFACTAAAAVLARAQADALAHCQVAHRSAEPGHARLLHALNLRPLFDFDMRLGEASGSALAAGLVRAAVLTHGGMATFASAGVSGPSA